MSIHDGEVRVSGKPDGYFATRDSYRNYVLRFEWMYERPSGLSSDASFRGNSGLLIHIAGPHKVWPVCIAAAQESRVHEAGIDDETAAVIIGADGKPVTRLSASLEREATRHLHPFPINQLIGDRTRIGDAAE